VLTKFHSAVPRTYTRWLGWSPLSSQSFNRDCHPSPRSQPDIPRDDSHLSRSESNCQKLGGPWRAASRLPGDTCYLAALQGHTHSVLQGLSILLAEAGMEGCHAWVSENPAAVVTAKESLQGLRLVGGAPQIAQSARSPC
jgi:hypothetical protein